MNPRELFFDRVYDLVKKGEDIVVVTPDLAAPSLDKYRKDFPERYLSVGVAEQNLVVVACGLALSGKKVIAWGLNPFVITRALDQIRNTVSLMNIPIILAGLHAGLSSAVSGPTHVVISDLSIIRTCANITTYNPSDCSICNDIFDEILKFKKPIYMRFDKDITYDIKRTEISFSDGLSIVSEGVEAIVVTTGHHLSICAEAIRQLDKSIALLDVFSFPCNKEALARKLRKYPKVIVVEEHILQGGLGDVVLESVSDYGCPAQVKRIGIDIEKGYPDNFGRRDYFNRFFGLDRENLKESLGGFLNS